MKSIIRRMLPVLLLAVLALTVCGIAACAGGHTHVYGPWESNDRLCTEEGLRTRTCVICGDREERVLPAGVHIFDGGTITDEPDCTTAGTRVRTCTVCGTTETVSISPLGHDWNTNKLIREPDCDSTGLASVTCARCGTQDENHELEALGHDWQPAGIDTQPTCTKTGLRKEVCSRCDEERGVEMAALGHRWTDGAIIEEPDCEHTGTRHVTCERCGEGDTATVAALGHDWQGEYTIDVEPTFERAGKKSYHCSRCDKTNGEVEVPKLDHDTPIPYEFRVYRNNGVRLSDPNVEITVLDANGTTMATSTPSTMNAGVFRRQLLPATYTVRVTGLPAGYTSNEATYTVTAGNPYCSIYLTAAPLSTPADAGTRYTVGSVMHNFTLHDVDGTAYTLSEVLREKRALVLNFWYIGCGPCRTEFPLLDAGYNNYKDKIALLSITETDGNTKDAVISYAREGGLSIPMVSVEEKIGLQSMFGVTDVPTTVVIDAEGVVSYIHVGAFQTLQEVNALFETYTSDTYWKRGPHAVAAALDARYLLPAGVRNENE